MLACNAITVNHLTIFCEMVVKQSCAVRINLYTDVGWLSHWTSNASLVSSLIITITISSNVISCFIFDLPFCTVVIRKCNQTVGCNWTPVIRVEATNHTKSTQLNPSITELITITMATTTYPETWKFQNGGVSYT